MLWLIHERHIAKSDFPQFPDGIYISPLDEHRKVHDTVSNIVEI